MSFLETKHLFGLLQIVLRINQFSLSKDNIYRVCGERWCRSSIYLQKFYNLVIVEFYGKANW